MYRPESKIDELYHKALQPFVTCPNCGQKTTIKTSFKGRSMYRNKRKTEYCDCGWSNIIPTEREAENEIGLLD